jgi:hypothetical protein
MRLTHIVTLISLVTVFGSACHADSTACPLTGIKNVYVKVTSTSDATKDGIDQEAYQTKVELKLREAGIAITSDESAPWLCVYIDTIDSDDGTIVAITIHSEILEDATIERLGDKTVTVTSWYDSHIGLAGKDKIKDVVDSCIDEESDTFSNDYLKDNPPAAPTETPATPTNGASQ